MIFFFFKDSGSPPTGANQLGHNVRKPIRRYGSPFFGTVHELATPAAPTSEHRPGFTHIDALPARRFQGTINRRGRVATALDHTKTPPARFRVIQGGPRYPNSGRGAARTAIPRPAPIEIPLDHRNLFLWASRGIFRPWGGDSGILRHGVVASLAANRTRPGTMRLVVAPCPHPRFIGGLGVARRGVAEKFTPATGTPRNDQFKFRYTPGYSNRKDYARDTKRRGRIATTLDHTRTPPIKFRILQGYGNPVNHGRVVSRRGVAVKFTPTGPDPRTNPFKFRSTTGYGPRLDHGRVVKFTKVAEKFRNLLDPFKFRTITGYGPKGPLAFARGTTRREVAENFTSVPIKRRDMVPPSARGLVSSARGARRALIPHPPGVRWTFPFVRRVLKGGVPTQLTTYTYWGARFLGPNSVEIKQYIPSSTGALYIEVGYESPVYMELDYSHSVRLTLDYPEDLTMELDIAV